MVSWALYDFANTIFAMNILSLYFVLWVTEDNSGTQLTFSMFLSASMLVSAITSPFYGSITDMVGKRVFLLSIGVIICAVSTSLIGRIGGVTAGLILFAIANYSYQSANIFYDSLLPVVSNPGNRGKISGFGVSLGYIGTITGILMVSPFVKAWGRQAAFIPTAFLFLLFSVPCLTMVSEKNRPSQINIDILRRAYTNVYHLIRESKTHKASFQFIIARFFYLDAINTLIVFMAVFVSQVLNYSDKQIETLLIVSTTSAIFGALIYGKITDKIGPKKTLLIILSQWIVVFSAATLTKNPLLFWLIGSLAGISLGALWASDRAFLLQISPRDQIGAYFGFYQLVGRFSSVIGPLLWGVTTDTFSDLGNIRFRIATAVLIAPLVIGIALLTRTSDKPTLNKCVKSTI
tara:strand:- start:19093 stop:20307 length:1215 start_codon:yes stop_codon:yes gene_type:complete